MADFFSSMCNSALQATPARPPGTGDTAGRLGGARGGRHNDPPRPLRRSRPWDGFQW